MLILLLFLLPDLFFISGAKKRRKKFIYQIFKQESMILGDKNSKIGFCWNKTFKYSNKIDCISF